MSEVAPDPKSVFLNVPYDAGYQNLFVTLVTALICLGQKPRCVLEIRDGGQGRLARLFSLLRSCRVSIHDLSRVGRPPRFNMPFELGLACSLGVQSSEYEVVVMEAKPYRLDKHLSDYKGRDPLIHNNRCDDLVACLLDLYSVPGEPSPRELRESAKLIRRAARESVEKYRRDTIFYPALFRTLVASAYQHAVDRGYIESE